MMRLLPTLLALTLSACAALKSSDAPGCSGPRRPANPHGSVLASDPGPATAARPANDVGPCRGAAP